MLAPCDLILHGSSATATLLKATIARDKRSSQKARSSAFEARNIPTTEENIIATTFVKRPSANANKPSRIQAIVRVGDLSRSRTFDDEQQARSFARICEAELEKDQAKIKKAESKARAGDPTLFDFKNTLLHDALMQFCESSDSTERHHSNAPTILKHIGGVKIGEINTRWVKDYTEDLRKSKTRVGQIFSFSTISVHIHILSRACNWLAEQLNLPKQDLPFSTKHFPKNWNKGRSRRLEFDEEIRLRHVLRHIKAPSSPHWRCLTQLALETGARLQELVLAEWSEVEISRRIWNMPEDHTKCVKARAVPLSKRAIRYLRFLRKDASQESTRIFHRLGDPQSVSTGFHLYVTKTGLENFKFHDLRHEAVSRMVLYKRKLSVFEIMAIVGHTEMKMLLRYANLRGDELANRMD